METFNKLSGCFMAVLLTVFIILLTPIVGGLVLTKLWLWFFVPLGLPVLNIPWAIGIFYVIAFLTHQDSTPKKNKFDIEPTVTERWINTLAIAFGKPLLYLLIGYVVLQFM